MAPYDSEDRASLAQRIYIGILIAVGVAAVLAVLLGPLVNAAGAQTRDYAGLTGNQLPTITHIEFDGAGHAHVAGTIPLNGTWHLATFHVPHPADWLDGQGDPTDHLILTGSFEVTLACEPGAAQVDLWLEGEDQPYAAAKTDECGTSQVPSTAVMGAPAEGPAAQSEQQSAPASGTDGGGESAPTSVQEVTAATPQAAATSSGERRLDDARRPPEGTATVASPAAPTALAATGAGQFTGAFLLAGVVLLILGASIVVGTWLSHKDDKQDQS